jgi:hypothetical protein
MAFKRSWVQFPPAPPEIFKSPVSKSANRAFPFCVALYLKESRGVECLVLVDKESAQHVNSREFVRRMGQKGDVLKYLNYRYWHR